MRKRVTKGDKQKIRNPSLRQPPIGWFALEKTLRALRFLLAPFKLRKILQREKERKVLSDRKAYKRCGNTGACIYDFNNPWHPLDPEKKDDPENLVFRCHSDPEEGCTNRPDCECFVIVLEYEFEPGRDEHIKLGDEHYFDPWPTKSEHPNHLTKGKLAKDFPQGGKKRYAVMCSCLKVDEKHTPIPL